VKYIGSLNFEQKRSFLAEAKAVLMPIQWDDPLPTVALESLASGTPVIASLVDAGNYREWEIGFSRIIDRGDGSESKGP
jgi:glycosyltransferase involved in cell wall biosynthesis